MSWQAFFLNIYLRHCFKSARVGGVDVLGTRRAVDSWTSRRQRPLPAGVRLSFVEERHEPRLPAAEVLHPPVEERSVLYLHGGGYFFGSPATHRPLCGYLCAAARARVVSIDYRLAPENAFPAAVADALSWYRVLLEETPSSNVFLAGDSAGGGLALACLLAAQRASLPMPAAAILYSPWVDLTCTGTTLTTLTRSDVMLSATGLSAAASMYLGVSSPLDPLASPLFGDMSGLPPLLIFASRQEVLLSDSIRLHRKVLEADGSSTLHLRDGLPHAWPVFLGLPEAREALHQSAAFMKQQPAPGRRTPPAAREHVRPR